MSNFSPALMQQQQQTQQQQQLNQQQQPQQPQDPHQSFSETGRMWQQIQQIPYNRPPAAGSDMNQQQQNSQASFPYFCFTYHLPFYPARAMMDLLRSQNLARLQGMQQQLNTQQQFPLGGQQVGNMGGGPANNQPQLQNQSFLEPGSNPSQAPGFPSGMPNPGMQQQPQSVNRSAILQALQANANPGHARQLEMLLAQNQPGLAQRLEHQRAAQQQAQQLQSSPGELFPSGAVDRRPSPQNPIANPQQQQQQQPQSRRFSPTELGERIVSARNYIANQERNLAQLGNQRGLTPDTQLLGKMRAVSDDIKSKKEYLAKMVSAMNNFTVMAQAQAQQVNGSGQAPWFNPTSQMTSGQPQNAQQVGQASIPQGHSSPLIRQQAQQLQQINRPSAGAIPRPPSVQRSHNPSGPLVPGPGSSLANQLSPNMNPQFPFPMNSVNGSASSPLAGPIGLQSSPSGTMQLPPPLEKSRFDNAYKSFCATKGLKLNPHMINYEGRDIDLYMLHTHVMQEGGFVKVAAQDLWGIIGGRMGFVNFPGSETEPAKAGPGLAQRLAQVYREYLANFDQVYINSVMDSRRKMQALHQAHMAQTQAAAAAAAAAGTSNGSLPQNHTLRGALNGHQMQMVVGYAHQSVEELRRQGVQERIISFVESNRAYLQRTAMEQGMFRGQLNQGMRPEQHGISVAGPPFQNSSHQAANSQHANFLPQPNGLPPSIPGTGFMGNRQAQIPQPPHPSMQNGSLVAQPKNMSNTLQRIKLEAKAQFMQNTQVVDVPMEQRAEFNTILNQLFGAAQEIDKQLPTYLIVLKSEELVRRLFTIMLTVSQQRSFLNSPSPRYIVTFEVLRNMMQQVQQATERMNGHLRQHMGLSPQQHPLHTAGNMPHSTLPIQDRPPSSLHQQPQSLAPSNRPPRPSPVAKKPSVSTPNAAVSTPTPPSYSASTPVASASTPTHTASSPPAPKSPKGKAPVKPKNPPKRRPSVKNRPSTPAPPATEQEPTPPASSKRPREDGAINGPEASPGVSGSNVANEPSPPKRPKTEGEWGGPANEAVVTKKAEAVENMKTEEDASAFLEQMTEFIKMAGEGQEALSSDISETLDQILKGYGSVPDGTDTLHGFSSFGSLGEPSSQASTSKPHPDEFVEFFDFSSFTAADEENDTDSKAPTPELSSTGPSPDSGSEADAAQHVLLSMEPVKTEELPDLLRLGPWKEIDGGESAYYHTADGWKWDSPMPTLEQPWAIFNS
ncbi:hypothetical protein C0995_001266 [Termitomyces sp. Mi166|nr:hypothetical protein C0995_001266 [Termitomyces sp. Mi166\